MANSQSAEIVWRDCCNFAVFGLTLQLENVAEDGEKVKCEMIEQRRVAVKKTKEELGRVMGFEPTTS